MPRDDGTPTTAEWIEADNQRIKNAIKANHGFWMNERELLIATMKYLQGKANPTAVRHFVREYLDGGYQFRP